MKNLLFVLFLIVMWPFMLLGFVWHLVRWGFALGESAGVALGQWFTE